MSSVSELEPRELDRRLREGEDLLLVDVRETEELAICRLEGVRHIPLHELPARLDELDRTRPLVCICHHGIRSAHAARFLVQSGFEQLFNLSGGMERWAVEVDPQMARY